MGFWRAALLVVAGELYATLVVATVGRWFQRRYGADRPLVHDGIQWWTPCRIRERLGDGPWSRRRFAHLRLDGRDALWRVLRAERRLPAEGAVASWNGDAVRIAWPDGYQVEVTMQPTPAADLYAAFRG